MKKLFLALALAFLAVNAQAFYPEQINTPQGSFFRVVNNDPYPVSCFVKDQFTYMTFYVYPGQASMWYPVRGHYTWSCRFS